MDCKKVKFLRESDATGHIAKYNRTAKQPGKRRAYFCDHCSNWHVTSQEAHKDVWISELQKKCTEYKRKLKDANITINKLHLEIKQLKIK